LFVIKEVGMDVIPSSLVKHFESLPDPRHERNRRHLLVDVIVISVCAVLGGCEGPTAIHRWAKVRKEWLGTMLTLPRGIPSRDCIRRVLTLLKPEAFRSCFQEWIASCFADDGVRHIAIDGKTLRRSHDREAGLGPLHVVSAWASETGLALGQLATDEKSNEIAAIPEVIEQIDVEKAIVTIDAMGCQREIAQKIVAAKGDYVLAVKDNQPKLHEEIDAFFSEHVEDDCTSSECRRAETKEKSHGREEYRSYYLAELPEKFTQRTKWAGLKAIGLACRLTRHADGSETHETRYYITSCYLSGKRFAEAVRSHWAVENSLHWVLDVTYNEDQSRARDRHLADNLAWLRRFAIGLLKQHPSNHSIKGKQQMAGWSPEFMTEVLVGTGV
jgi:predicted transposase YbfD/YdcC